MVSVNFTKEETRIIATALRLYYQIGLGRYYEINLLLSKYYNPPDYKELSLSYKRLKNIILPELRHTPNKDTILPHAANDEIKDYLILIMWLGSKYRRTADDGRIVVTDSYDLELIGRSCMVMLLILEKRIGEMFHYYTNDGKAITIAKEIESRYRKMNRKKTGLVLRIIPEGYLCNELNQIQKMCKNIVRKGNYGDKD